MIQGFYCQTTQKQEKISIAGLQVTNVRSQIMVTQKKKTKKITLNYLCSLVIDIVKTGGVGSYSLSNWIAEVTIHTFTLLRPYWPKFTLGFVLVKGHTDGALEIMLESQTDFILSYSDIFYSNFFSIVLSFLFRNMFTLITDDYIGLFWFTGLWLEFTDNKDSRFYFLLFYAAIRFLLLQSDTFWCFMNLINVYWLTT